MELFNEAVSRYGVQECQGFKSIFISKSSIINDNSIEITDENMVLCLCIDLTNSYLIILSKDQIVHILETK